jgi:hypothetical protein
MCSVAITDRCEAALKMEYSASNLNSQLALSAGCNVFWFAE